MIYGNDSCKFFDYSRQKETEITKFYGFFNQGLGELMDFYDKIAFAVNRNLLTEKITINKTLCQLSSRMMRR